MVGLYGIFMWLGITLGTLAGTVAMRVSGFPAVWGLCAIAAAGRHRVRGRQEGSAAARNRRRRLGSLLPRAAVVPGLAVALAALGYAALAAFVSLHMLARGVANGIAAFDAFGFTYIGVRLFIGNVPDRLGPRMVAFWSALVEAAGLVIVAVATNLITVIIGGLVIGAGLSLLFPSLALIVINRAPESQRGAALGAFTSFWDVGNRRRRPDVRPDRQPDQLHRHLLRHGRLRRGLGLPGGTGLAEGWPEGGRSCQQSTCTLTGIRLVRGGERNIFSVNNEFILFYFERFAPVPSAQ